MSPRPAALLLPWLHDHHRTRLSWGVHESGSSRAAHWSQKVAAQSPSLPPGASGSQSWHAEDPAAATHSVVAACWVGKYGGPSRGPVTVGEYGDHVWAPVTE